MTFLILVSRCVVCQIFSYRRLSHWWKSGAKFMRGRFFRILVLLLIGFVAASPSIAQGRRVALVIGNSEYKHTPRLDNPKHDAADMATTLGNLGFAVMEGRDLDKASMDLKIRDFAQALRGAQVG